MTIGIDTKTQSLQDCLKSASSFGETTYYNICDGTQHVIPWGLGDYIASFALMTFGLIFLGIFVLMASMAWHTIAESRQFRKKYR